MLLIITCETKSKCQLTIGVFSIAFVMSVIEKLTEFLADDAIRTAMILMVNKRRCNDLLIISTFRIRIYSCSKN